MFDALRKNLVCVCVGIFVACVFSQNVAYAADDDPYCEYKSVDVVYNFNSSEECYVSTTAVAGLQNVNCWSANYALDTNCTSEFMSFEAHDSNGNPVSFSYERNEEEFTEGGEPDVNECVIDESSKTIYVNTASFNEGTSEGSSFTGEVTLKWIVKLTDFANFSSNGEFLFVPFATDKNSEVSDLNVEFIGLKHLGFEGIFVYPWGDVLDTFEVTARPAHVLFGVEMNDVSASYTGKIYHSATNKVILSTHDLGWFVSFEYFIIKSLGNLVLLTLLMMILVLIYVWLRTKTISHTKTTYFRDIPKVKNPVRSVIRAMSYRNPKVRNLEDAIKEKDLIAYILLSNEREGKIEFLDDVTIKLHWNKLSDTEKRVYDKLSCNYMCKKLAFVKTPLEMQGEDVAVIHLDMIKELPTIAKSADLSVSSEESLDVIGCYNRHLGSEYFENWEAFDRDSNEAKKKRERLAIILGICLSFIATIVLVAMFDRTSYFTALWLIFINIFVTSVKLGVFIKERNERVSREEFQEIEQIYGLKNWIRDFTNLKEAKPSAGIVWGEFLEWTYLLGESERGLAILKGFSENPSKMVENVKLNLYFATSYSGTASSVMALLNVAEEMGADNSKFMHKTGE